MILVDKQIKCYGNNLISPYAEDKVKTICYDLTSIEYCIAPNEVKKSIILEPMESVFVKCKEVISLPSNLVGKVILRNSRIRQGLSLDAPVYYPGHKTNVFFRVTNISKDSIELIGNDGIASIMFECVDEPETPYDGAFQGEFEFKGMGSYSDVLSGHVKKVDNKLDKLENLENKLYSNVLAIMAVFVAIFSIVNINAAIVMAQLKLKTIVVMNLSLIGSMGLLIDMIGYINPDKKKIKHFIWIPVFALVGAAIMAIC